MVSILAQAGRFLPTDSSNAIISLDKATPPGVWMSRSAPLYALQQIDKEIAACHARLAVINQQLGESERACCRAYSRGRDQGFFENLAYSTARSRAPAAECPAQASSVGATALRRKGSQPERAFRPPGRGQVSLATAGGPRGSGIRSNDGNGRTRGSGERGIRELEQIELQWKEDQAELIAERRLLRRDWPNCQRNDRPGSPRSRRPTCTLMSTCPRAREV